MQIIELTHRNLIPGEKFDSRKRDKDGGIAQLAQSIKTRGLLYPLITRAAGEGKFHIVAGNRRFKAIMSLLAAGEWADDKPINCILSDGSEAQAHEDSLIENLVRRNLDPLEVYEAIKDAIDAGSSVAEIVARTGLEKKTVDQAFALGALHQEIRDALAANHLRIEAAQLFTLEPNLEKQVVVFRQLFEQRRLWADDIRKALMIDWDTTKLLSFVGRARYEDCGGLVHEDLFGSNLRVSDTALLRSMARETKETLAKGYVDGGWKFAVFRDDVENPWTWPMVEVKPAYTDAETERLKEIADAQGALCDDDGEVLEGNNEAYDALETEEQVIADRATERACDAEFRAKHGLMLEISEAGIKTMMCREPAEPKLTAKAKAEKAEAAGEKPEAKEPTVSAALLADMWKMQTAAASEAIGWKLAMAVTIDALENLNVSPAKIGNNGLGAKTGRPHSREGFALRIAQILDLKDADMKARFARAVGSSLDLVSFNPAAPRHEEEALIALLDSKAYRSAMLEAFDRERFFAGISGKLRTKAIEDMDGRNTFIGKGKADHVAYCIYRAAQTKWLPEQFIQRPLDEVLVEEATKLEGKGVVLDDSDPDGAEAGEAEPDEYADDDDGAPVETV